jgi:salicylate hydroxylase
MTSFFGQGGCQAIEDAAELANALQNALAIDSTSAYAGDMPAALREFGNSREARAKSVAGFSASYARLFTANLPFGMGPFVRKMVYTYVPSRAWLWWLSWLYGYQPVIKELESPKTEVKKSV